MEKLINLDHPNIVNIHEIYEDETRYYVIMDYCEGQELLEAVIERGYFNERDA